MDYKFLDSSVDEENIILPDSDKINPFLLKNNYAELIKAVDFIASDDITLYIHGFLGTGKRQFINYAADFLSNDVIKLEYYCKSSTVCDDILLSFIDTIEKNAISKAVNLNTKITTLAVKFQQYVSSIKKPFIIILHSFDDIQEGIYALHATLAYDTDIFEAAEETDFETLSGWEHDANRKITAAAEKIRVL